MAIIENKRVSQLTQMTAAEVQPNDLLLIIDTTAHESKNITILDFETYILGIGSVVTLAYTASYIEGSNVYGYVNLAYNANTSSYSNYSNTSSYSNYSNTSSYSSLANGLSPSVVVPTASYLNYTIGRSNGTSSYAINSLSSSISNVTNYLAYNGVNNGTASYALSSNVVNAQTASYINSSIASVASASYANIAGYSLGGQSDTTNYLNFSPNNGTASYAISAGTVENFIAPQGIFLSITQSTNSAQIDDIDIYWSTTNPATTLIEAIGTVDIPFTSSTTLNGSSSLGLIDRNTGYKTILDCTPILLNISQPVGGGNVSGSVSIPFTLAGQASLYGSYLVYVTSSNNNIRLDSRKVRFRIDTESDTFSEYSNVPFVFSATPSYTQFSFTSTDGGPFTDIASNIAYSASLGKNIYTIQSLGGTLGSLNYFWTLPGTISASFSNNYDFSYMSGVPNTLQYLICNNAPAMFSLYSMTSSSLLYFDCDSDSLSSLPTLPYSMSYINCSNNNITNLSSLPVTLSYLNCSTNSLVSLPSSLPYGLTTFLVGGNPALSSLPSPLTNTISTMSIDYDTSISSISYLPLSLSYFSAIQCPISSLPSVPSHLLYLSLLSCSFNISTFNMDFVTNGLVSNAVSYPSVRNGTIDIRGYGNIQLYDPTTYNNITTLVNSYGWTAYYDT